MNYRFELLKTSKKSLCPHCSKLRFVRFIDNQTKELLPPIYGRCDREANCGYYLNPYENGFANEIMKQENEKPIQWQSRQQQPGTTNQQQPKPVFIPAEILQATQSRPIEQNTFFKNLETKAPFPFDPADLLKVSKLYKTGTIIKGYLTGSITFPFIDLSEKVRAIQVKQFDQQNHTTKTTFIHALLSNHYQQTKQPIPEWLKAYSLQEKKVTCFFGEHLLKEYPKNPIALVEAPKTCIYGTLYFGFPNENQRNFLWLSTFNLSSLQKEKAIVLKGRTVILFPDLSATGKAFELWKEKAIQFEKEIPDTRFIVSDLLEKNATAEEKNKGFDMADFLIKQDWKQYRQTNSSTKPPILKSIKDQANDQGQKQAEPFQIIKPETPIKWNISELEKLFLSNPIPETPIKLNQCETILNPKRYISVSIETLKANQGNPTFQSVYDNLIKVKEIIYQTAAEPANSVKA